MGDLQTLCLSVPSLSFLSFFRASTGKRVLTSEKRVDMSDGGAGNPLSRYKLVFLGDQSVGKVCTFARAHALLNFY